MDDDGEGYPGCTYEVSHQIKFNIISDQKAPHCSTLH